VTSSWFYSSVITMMHGPTSIKFSNRLLEQYWRNDEQYYSCVFVDT